MSGRPSTIVREGETDHTLEHYTDTDPNRIQDNNNRRMSQQQQQQQYPGVRRTSSSVNNNTALVVSGTDGNPLKGQPKREESGSLPGPQQSQSASGSGAVS